jgi:hypothetical protein
MALFLKLIEQEFAGADEQTCIYILLKCIRLKKEMVLDQENRSSLMDQIMKISFEGNDELHYMAVKAMENIEKEFPEINMLPREALLEKLSDSNRIPFELYWALKRLSRQGNRDDVPFVMDYLESKNPKLRCAAAECMEAFATIKELPLILPLLIDEDKSVKSAAARALKKLGLIKAIPVLQELVQSKDLNKVQLGLNIICVMQTHDAIVKMLIYLTQARFPKPIRMEAIKNLAKRDYPLILPRLEELAQDLDIDICEVAIEARNHQKQTTR